MHMQGITVRNEADGLYIARILTGSMIERQGAVQAYTHGSISHPA